MTTVEEKGKILRVIFALPDRFLTVTKRKKQEKLRILTQTFSPFLVQCEVFLPTLKKSFLGNREEQKKKESRVYVLV